MDTLGESGLDWTRDLVEACLIAAFRALPFHPVFRQRARILPALGDASQHTAALNWVARFAPDERDGQTLLTWASCKATGKSVRERYRELRWNRSSAERARRRASAWIAACLIKEQQALDSGTNSPGASRPVEVDEVLADA